MVTLHLRPHKTAAEMADEYGKMDSEGETHIIPKFALDSGKVIEDCTIRYKTWGKLNARKNNVVMVCHALTGNADLMSWWGDLLGPGKPFDTDKYLVVCANVLGSPYGSSSPVQSPQLCSMPPALSHLRVPLPSHSSRSTPPPTKSTVATSPG